MSGEPTRTSCCPTQHTSFLRAWHPESPHPFILLAYGASREPRCTRHLGAWGVRRAKTRSSYLLLLEYGASEEPERGGGGGGGSGKPAAGCEVAASHFCRLPTAGNPVHDSPTTRSGCMGYSNTVPMCYHVSIYRLDSYVDEWNAQIHPTHPRCTCCAGWDR